MSRIDPITRSKFEAKDVTTMHCNFHGKRVLVVEDNTLLAVELSATLSAANAIVVGPCRTPGAAKLQLVHCDLAVLGVDLCGVKVFDLADRLDLLDVPYVFFSGYDRAALPDRFARIDYIARPQPPLIAVLKLDALSREQGHQDIDAVVPVLRRRARVFLSDPRAADRLVELTLRQALDNPAPTPAGAALTPWLLQLMDVLMQSGRGHLMN